MSKRNYTDNEMIHMLIEYDLIDDFNLMVEAKMKLAYRAGFKESGEGWNGDYTGHTPTVVNAYLTKRFKKFLKGLK